MQVQEMKAGGNLPLRTWGSLSLARQLISAGLVDRLRLMTFPLMAGLIWARRGLRGHGCLADLNLAGHRLDLDGRAPERSTGQLEGIPRA